MNSGVAIIELQVFFWNIHHPCHTSKQKTMAALGPLKRDEKQESLTSLNLLQHCLLRYPTPTECTHPLPQHLPHTCLNRTSSACKGDMSRAAGSWAPKWPFKKSYHTVLLGWERNSVHLCLEFKGTGFDLQYPRGWGDDPIAQIVNKDQRNSSTPCVRSYMLV